MDFNKHIYELKKLFDENNICESHGIKHAISVMNHAICALEVHKYTISQIEYNSIIIASLLHDADDYKFFPNNQNNDNARYLLKDNSEDFIDLVINMIELVSSSKNADTIPDSIQNKEWMLIPRYADRLEAIGIIGIERCYKYNKTINKPLYLPTTLRATNIEELLLIATKERYNTYCGNSISMIDHYYDKLIRLSDFSIKNQYLNQMAIINSKPITDLVLFFGKNETINDDDILMFIKNYNY